MSPRIPQPRSAILPAFLAAAVTLSLAAAAAVAAGPQSGSSGAVAPPARVALVGASGNVGSELLKELARRGYQVTAIARNPERIEALPGVSRVAADAGDIEALATALRGNVAVISALPFRSSDPAKLTAAVRAAGIERYLVVGGAGSLQVADGGRLLDTPGFPDAYKVEASAGAAFLEYLRGVPDLAWTFLSPSAEFVDGGPRTGRFRLGQDRLLQDEAGRSWISYADYAIALVDELETPAHLRRRFTVGY